VTTGPVYRAAPRSDLAPSVALEGFTLIYHRSSGATHMLAEPVPEILAALAEGEGSAAEITRRLARDYGLDSDEAAEAVIAARMAELAALGLIEVI